MVYICIYVCILVLKDRHKLPGILKKKANGGIISAVDVEAFGIYAQATLDNCKRNNITQYKDVYLHAGDTIIWHPLLPHGGSKILDITRTRYITCIIYIIYIYTIKL